MPGSLVIQSRPQGVDWTGQPTALPNVLGRLVRDNRVLVSPMCQYSADQGPAIEWRFLHLGNLVSSRPGLMIIEATGVEPCARITPGCLGMCADENGAALARVLGFRRQRGAAKMGLRLGHAGRKVSVQRPWERRDPLFEEQGAWHAIEPTPESGESADIVAAGSSDQGCC